MKKRALISVSDKEGVLEFSKELVALGFEIISTGGTKKFLEQGGVSVFSVADITGFPEILDGRVKTLHPNIHAALLCNRDLDEHVESLHKHHISYIDIVVVNLYPFKKTIQQVDVKLNDAIEQIDIGGPSMLRSAAKNFKHLTVIVEPKDYAMVLQELKEKNEVSLLTKQKLSAKVFQHTAEYDAVIANYLSQQTEEQHNEVLQLKYEKIADLRYGENPHQKAWLYTNNQPFSYSLTSAKQLHGKELSFNNLQDAEAALQLLQEFHEETAFVGIKHANPCGVGVAQNSLDAWNKMYYGDVVSIFGGIVACNQTIEEDLAQLMKEIFLEVILAPNFSNEALKILKEKKNLRLLQVPMTDKNIEQKKIISINGGALLQDADSGKIDLAQLAYPTILKPSQSQLQDLLFSWKVVKHVKSNAIVVAHNQQSIGIGAGQMNRIGSAKIALTQAQENKNVEQQNWVLASDAFFPFNDVVLLAKQFNIVAIIQPGGSIKDNESISACNDHNIAMVFTGLRHFKH